LKSFSLSDNAHKVFIGCVLILLFFTSMFWFVSIQENLHVKVAEANGCEASNPSFLPSFDEEVGLDDRNVWVLGVVNYTCENFEDFERVQGQQLNIDAVGYQVMPIYIFAVIIVILQLFSFLDH